MGFTLADYAMRKHLPAAFLQELGLQDFKYAGKPAVKIPYFAAGGSESAVRLRLASQAGEHADTRFKWRTGDKPILYGLWRLDLARKLGYVVLVEGESDCHTLWHHGIPALGLPGANSWRQEWAEHLDGIDTIYVVVEPDQGGQTVLERIGSSPIRDRVRLVHLDPHKDPSELYLANPETFGARWQSAIEVAIPWTDQVRAEAQARSKQAWEICQTLAHQPDILHVFAETQASHGVVGEDRLMKLVYLAFTSRLLERPLSVAIKGPSAAGKSFAVERTQQFFPPSAYYALTAMSERALAYSDEPLSHRILVLYEAAGMTSAMASYLIRSLLSEGRVRYETVEKTAEGFKPRLIEREGPTGLIVTTTAVTLHPENETRLLSIPATDTVQQTQAILRALGVDRTGQEEFDPTTWHALQVWLEGAEHRVVIPYGAILVDLIPPIAVRLRRDVTNVLSLIKTHAILHQASRKRDTEGRIIATLDDYAAIRPLIADLVAEGIEATVNPTIKETVEAVRALAEEHRAPVEEGIPLSLVATKLGLDKSAASRRIKGAIARGYLKNMETRRGRPSKLCVGDPLPAETTVLPEVETLAARCTVAASTEGLDRPSLHHLPDTDSSQPIGTFQNENVTTAAGAERAGATSVAKLSLPVDAQNLSSRLADAPAPFAAPQSPILVSDTTGLDAALHDLSTAPVVGLDLETTGLDPKTDQIRIIQLAIPSRVYVVDCERVAPIGLAPLLNSVPMVVGHNLKFDLGFLQAAGLPIPDGDRLFDTMLASQLLHAGTDVKHSLAAVAEREVGITLNKGQQTSDWSGSLTTEQLRYAADDAAILLPLYDTLARKLQESQLEQVAAIEMRALPAAIWMEAAGVPIDVAAWSALRDQAISRQAVLNDQIASMLSGVNLNSGPQLITALSALGIVVANVQESTLRAVADQHPVMALILERKELQKRVTTYANSYLNAVNPKTGRLHANFQQIGAASGRMACSRPNLQNIPRDPAYRKCIRPKAGRVLVKADYSQIELRIAAQISGDKAMREAFNCGEDLHTLTALAVLGREPTKADRQLAKALNFGLIYGMGSARLRAYAKADYGVDLTEEEAQQFRERFFMAYPGLRRWHRSLPEGSIATRTLTDRRRLKVEKFTEQLNSPVQGTGADIVKLALARLWEDRDAVPSAVPVLVVHDEIVIEVDMEEAEAAKIWLTEHMVAAGNSLLQNVPVVVEAAVVGDWNGSEPNRAVVGTMVAR